MRKRGRVDMNQHEIVAALRKMGCSVLLLSSQGSGCPDILVGVSGVNVLCEIKNDETRGKLNIDQIQWHDDWRGLAPVILKSVDHAIRMVNYYRRGADEKKPPVY
jgi:Holliday junction resolvase